MERRWPNEEVPLLAKVVFPRHYTYDHPPVRDPNTVSDRRLTVGDRVSDGFATLMGSWPFIIVQSGILIVWGILNVTAGVRHWDG